MGSCEQDIYLTHQCNIPEDYNLNFPEVDFFVRSVTSSNLMIQLINISVSSTSEVCMSEIFVLSMTRNLRMYSSVVSSAVIFVSGFMKICLLV